MRTNTRKFGPALTSLTLLLALVMPFFMVTPAGAQPSEVWVDDGFDASTPGWGVTHFDSIQDGIDAVASPGMVHVASGTYVENITLKDGVEVLGAGADVTTIDGGGAGSVVKAIDVGPGTVLSGFTIANGSGTTDLLGRSSGGGIYLQEASPVISNNVITDNSTGEQGATGGGIYAYFSSATIVHNIITDNSSEDGGGILIDNWPSGTGSMPNIEYNNIYGNSAFAGGGIYLQFSSPTVRSNFIAANTAAAGGGIAANNSSALVANNVIAQNSGGDYGGGGIRAVNNSLLLIMNNTIVNNSAPTGGGVSCSYSTLTIFNCIIWGNGDDLDGCTATYSNIEDGDSGEGNISAAPMFVDPAGGDHHLQADSPCIDAGTNEGAPAEDIEGNPRPIDGDGDGTAICDIGAYEFEPPTIIVPIDIKPGSDPNCFHNDGHGVIPVAILTTDTFDAAAVDPFSVALDSMGVRVKGKSGNAGSLEDVNGDGLDDLVVQIEDVDETYQEGDTIATLTGETFDGTQIQGTDTICIVP